MLRERPFADTRAFSMPRASRASKSTSCVAGFVLLLIRCFVKCAALAPASEVRGTNATVLSALPLRLPPEPRCPWLSEGVVGAARASPLVRAVVSRTRMAAPFGPGSWPDGFELPDERGEKTYGWTDAAVFSLSVCVDPEKAQKWLPNSLLRVHGDTARVFFAWYPDSFCCGAYHEAAIVLDVTHVPSGKRASHCPWMLVDSDRSMIAGREILGFPKKLGAFSFRVDGVELSSAKTDRDGEKNTSSLSAFQRLFRAGARVAATVSRGGVTLLDASGVLAAPAPRHTKAFSDDDGDETRGANRNRTERVVFLNAQTNHPIPGVSNADDTSARPTDSACVSNRPKLVQFAFDEVSPEGGTLNSAWSVQNASVSFDGTKTDPIAAPFETKRGGGRAAVLRVKMAVTSLYTGSEPTPTTGEEIPPGYVENDDVYWLRYQ